MIRFFGILTFISLLMTILTGLGVIKTKIVVHKIFAIITFVLSLIHIILVLLGYY